MLFFIKTAATISFNLSIWCCDNSDVVTQLLSAICHTFSTCDSIPDDVVFTLLMTLGRLIYKNQEAIDLVTALDLDVDKFQSSSSEKIKNAAKEVQLLLATPI